MEIPSSGYLYSTECRDGASYRTIRKCKRMLNLKTTTAGRNRPQKFLFSNFNKHICLLCSMPVREVRDMCRAAYNFPYDMYP